MKIFIVDDNMIVLEIVSIMLYKHDVTVFTDPVELLSRIESGVRSLLKAGFHINGRNDKGLRWYPSEPKKCCESIREPSRAYPWSLWKHCHSSKHILAYFGIKDDNDLPKLVGHSDVRVVSALEEALKV